ncbi:MAG: periplasmic heavy metal sensor [Alphaproteobacteria bacterium]
MKSNLCRNFITVGIAVILAAGAGWMGARYAVLHHETASVLHDMVHTGLNLNADQEQRLAIIEQKYANERKDKEEKIRTANRELAKAIGEGHQDSSQVETAIDHIHVAMGTLQKLTVMHVFEMRSVLTPEQAKKFDAEVAAVLNDASQ